MPTHPRHERSPQARFAISRAAAVSLLLALGAACADAPSAPIADGTPPLFKGKPAKCSAFTELRITMSEGANGSDALRADDAANTPYTEGDGGSVGAHLNGTTGRLMLWTSQYAAASRFVHVTASPLPAPDGQGFDGLTDDRIYTNNHRDAAGDDQACGFAQMAAGTSGDAVLEAELQSEGIVRYGKDCSGNVVDATRVATARLDANTWTISGASGVYCKNLSGKKKGKGSSLTQVGTAGPFGMTLEAI